MQNGACTIQPGCPTGWTNVCTTQPVVRPALQHGVYTQLRTTLQCAKKSQKIVFGLVELSFDDSFKLEARVIKLVDTNIYIYIYIYINTSYFSGIFLLENNRHHFASAQLILWTRPTKLVTMATSLEGSKN